MLKNTVLIIIIVSVIFANPWIFHRPAKAIFGIGDVVIDPTHIAATVGGWAKEAWRWVKDNLVKVLLANLKKRLLDKLVDETVKWIQGGGNPRFVTDW